MSWDRHNLSLFSHCFVEGEGGRREGNWYFQTHVQLYRLKPSSPWMGFSFQFGNYNNVLLKVNFKCVFIIKVAVLSAASSPYNWISYAPVRHTMFEGIEFLGCVKFLRNSAFFPSSPPPRTSPLILFRLAHCAQAKTIFLTTFDIPSPSPTPITLRLTPSEIKVAFLSARSAFLREGFLWRRCWEKLDIKGRQEGRH